MWGKMIKTLISLLFFLNFLSFAANDTLSSVNTKTEVMLDCSNYRIFDFNLTNKNNSDYSQPYTFILDTVFSFLSTDTSDFRLRAWGDLSSESGEPLFERFERAAANMEHMDYPGAEMHAFKNRLQIRGGYHHLGNYGDKILYESEKIANRYGYYPKYMEVGSYGISEYYVGTWKFTGNNSDARGIARKYGNWIYLPVKYDPVYVSGYRYSQDLGLKLADENFSAGVDFDRQKRYLDHLHSETVDVFSYDVMWKHEFSSSCDAGIMSKGKTENHHGYLFSMFLDNKINDVLSYSLKTGLWGNGEPEGECSIRWNPLEKLDMDLMARYAYEPSVKSINYLSGDGAAVINTESIRTSAVQSNLQYSKILNLPVSVRVWTLLQVGAPDYSVNYTDSVQLISISQSDDFIAAQGGRISVGIPITSISTQIDLWAQGNRFYCGELPEDIPFEAGLTAGYSGRKKDRSSFAFKLTYRSPYSVRINETLESKSDLFLNLSLNVPFYSPFFTEHLKPEIRIEAGPIHLLHNTTRQVFHPLGSVMGPAISARLTVDLM